MNAAAPNLTNDTLVLAHQLCRASEYPFALIPSDDRSTLIESARQIMRRFHERNVTADDLDAISDDELIRLFDAADDDGADAAVDEFIARRKVVTFTVTVTVDRRAYLRASGDQWDETLDSIEVALRTIAHDNLPDDFEAVVGVTR